jgi:hypothetical protein
VTPRAATTLISWLDSRMKKEKAQALAMLPSSVASRLSEMPAMEPPKGLIEPLENRLHGIHYSWFAPALSRLPPAQRSMAEQSLSGTRRGLRELPQLLLEYWQSWLWKQVVEKNWLPAKMVHAPEALRPLTRLTKAELIELIDLLGVFDVVPNLRRAIHSAEQKFWSEVLTPAQKKFAQKLLQQTSWPGQLPLGSSDSVEEAARALHQRGCLRLGAALHGSDEPFIWEIAHRLDSGRGGIVQQAASQTLSPEAHAASLHALTMALRDWSNHAENRGDS